MSKMNNDIEKIVLKKRKKLDSLVKGNNNLKNIIKEKILKWVK